MQVSFSRPLESAFGRTRTLLFEGFDPEKYLKIGLAAWLASMIGGLDANRGFFDASDWNWIGGLLGFERAGSPLSLVSPSWLTAVVGPLVLVALLFRLVMLWLSAHGSFILVDQVVRDRGDFLQPWSRLSGRANRLFVWLAALAIVRALLAAAWIGPLAFLAGWFEDNGFDGADVGPVASIIGIIIAGFAAIVFGFLLLVLWTVVHHFLIPLIYRDGGGILSAWRKLWPLVRRHSGEFLLYALLIGGMHLAVAAVLVALVAVTCCIAGFVLAIPFLNALLLLPWLIFLRTLSIEFLGQFGQEFQLTAIGMETDPEPEPPQGSGSGDRPDSPDSSNELTPTRTD